MISRIGSKKGFTLIEVLVAVSILAVGLVGVLRAYATSASVMERAQYDMDAVFLLKTAMGQIEEKAMTEKKMVPGTTNGAFATINEAGLDRTRSDRWLWSQEVQKMDLPSEKVKRDSLNNEKKSVMKKEKETDFFLNKLKLSIVNFSRTPLREVSLETYVRTESVKNS